MCYTLKLGLEEGGELSKNQVVNLYDIIYIDFR